MQFGTKAEFVEFLELLRDQIDKIPDFSKNLPEHTRAMMSKLPPEEVMASAISVTKKNAIKVVQSAIDIVESFEDTPNETISPHKE